MVNTEISQLTNDFIWIEKIQEMKKNTKKITPKTKKLINFLVQDFLETDAEHIKEIAGDEKKAEDCWNRIVALLFYNGFWMDELDPEDRRNVIVSLTANSKPFIKNLNENHVKLHTAILEKIDPDKREFVIEAMSDVIGALKKWSDSRE